MRPLHLQILHFIGGKPNAMQRAASSEDRHPNGRRLWLQWGNRLAPIAADDAPETFLLEKA